VEAVRQQIFAQCHQHTDHEIFALCDARHTRLR
jgi:hypothetical protein